MGVESVCLGSKVCAEWPQQVHDHWNAPGLTKQSLTTGHRQVSNVSVVFWKAEQTANTLTANRISAGKSDR